MNARKHRPLTWILIGLMCAGVLQAQSARESVAQGNALYDKANYSDALNQYEQALTDNPKAVQPKFNKANAYFRLDDLAQAIDLYREVSAESKDMGLVAKAKYNLGNSFFQRGMKQRDSNLQKAVDDLKTSISHWRQTLDIQAHNKQAARNIEVARLIIKDIMDQQNQQDPNQPQDPNQGQDQQQPSGQQNEQQDPNQPPDPNQPNSDPNEPQDQKEEQPPEEQQDPNQAQEQQQPMQQDMTAQEILDREQRQKKERQMRQRARHIKVDRDW